MSITCRVSSGFHCPTLIIETGCACRVSGSEPPNKKMSKLNARNRNKSTPDCCKTCSETTAKNESSFPCFKCNCRKDLTKQCTYLIEDAKMASRHLGETPSLFVAHAWMTDNPTNLSWNQKREASKTANYNELKKKWLTLKALSLKSKPWPKTNSQTRHTLRLPTVHQETTLPKKYSDGFELEESRESKNENARCRQEHDFN